MSESKPVHMMEFAGAVMADDFDIMVVIIEETVMSGDKHTSNYVLGIVNLTERFLSIDIAESVAIKLAHSELLISGVNQNA